MQLAGLAYFVSLVRRKLSSALLLGCIWRHVTSSMTNNLSHVQEEADWGTAKRVLGQPKFIERLMAYDADNIPDAVLEALQRVVSDARFTADQVCLTQFMPQPDNCLSPDK